MALVGENRVLGSCYPSHSLPLPPKWARTNTTLRNLERKVAAGFLEPRKPVFLRLGFFYLTETLPISFWSSDTVFVLPLPFKEIADNVLDLR